MLLLLIHFLSLSLYLCVYVGVVCVCARPCFWIVFFQQLEDGLSRQFGSGVSMLEQNKDSKQLWMGV